MTTDKPSRREPFVARREETAPLQADLGEQPATRPHGPQQAVAPKKSGFFVLYLIVVLLSVCLVALSFFSWRQNQSQQLLLQRFDELGGRLESNDESIAQSGAALALKISKQEETLATHWGEIKKLWGVANDRNKQAIKALQLADSETKKGFEKTQQALAALRADSSSLQKSLKMAQDDMITVKASMTTLQADVKKIGSASLIVSAQTDDFQRQLSNFDGQLKSLDSETNNLQKLIEKNRESQSRRLAEFEQAVKSMDAFRQQTNEKFSRLHP